MLEITPNNLDLLDKGTIVLKFWADWCKPCKTFAPIFENVASLNNQPHITFATIDAGNHDLTDLVSEFNIRNIPTILLLKDGHEVDRTGPIMSEEKLTAWVNKEV